MQRYASLFSTCVPLLGPLLCTAVVPSFEVIEKLATALVLVQALVLSCIAGNFTQAFECNEGVEPDVGTELVSQSTLAFQLLFLCLLLTLVLYAYVVFETRQEDPEGAEAALKQFWKDGGKFVTAGIVTLSVLGTIYYGQSVRLSVKCLYGDAFGIDSADPHGWDGLFIDEDSGVGGGLCNSFLLQERPAEVRRTADDEFPGLLRLGRGRRSTDDDRSDDECQSVTAHAPGQRKHWQTADTSVQ